MANSDAGGNLGPSLHELLNDGRISPRTDHLLWRLETALGDLPLRHLLELLEPSPYLAYGEFRELRESLAVDALAIRDWEKDC